MQIGEIVLFEIILYFFIDGTPTNYFLEVHSFWIEKEIG